MNSVWTRILVISLAMANCVGAFKLYAMRSSQNASVDPPRALAALRLPAGIDHRKPTLVTLGDSRHLDVPAIVARLAESDYVSRVNWVIFDRDLSRLPTIGAIAQAIKLEGDAPDARARLGVSGMTETWFLYDSTGALHSSGRISTGGVDGAIAQIVDGASALTDERIAVEVRRLERAGHFAEERELARSVSTSRHHALYVRRVLSGCIIQSVLTAFGSVAASESAARFSVIVPADWTDRDLHALSMNMSVPGRVVRASSGFTEAWDDLAWRFGPAAASGFLAVFSEGGVAEATVASNRVLTMLREASNAN